jgi:iron complex transport system substrate-binding protein
MQFSSRQLTTFLIVGCLSFIALSSCGLLTHRQTATTLSPSQDCRIVEHTQGETCVPIAPQRVVTLWTTIFANTIALGIHPIATSFYGETFDSYLEDYLQQSSLQESSIVLVGDLNSPNLEKILQLDPDLILANTRLESIYQQLSGITSTVMLSFPASLDSWSWKEHFIELSRVLDKEDKGKDLLDQYWHRIENLQQALGSRRYELQVSIASGNPEYGIWTYETNHPVGMVLKDIGLQRPVAQRGNSFYRNLSQEQLSMLDGDILFFLTNNQDKEQQEFLEKVRQNPLWQKLKVVQQDRVYFVDAGHWHALDILAMNTVIDDLYKYLVNTP